jgi:hypothetical protein
MLYREYGKTGKKISIVGFGGMRFEDINNREACVETMLEAARNGINYFDTAPAYFGVKSEEVFGEAFREFRRRGLPFYCSTKTGQAAEDDIRREIEDQLKRLDVATIDFYHIWCVTSLENWEERKRKNILNTFRSLKEEGLIRHISVSSHLIGDEIKELLMEGVFEGVLFGYSAHNFAFRQAAFEAIAEKNLGCVVMNPLGGGIIPQNPDVFDFVRTREDETVVEAALRFLFAHDRITAALVGFSNKEQVKEAVAAVEGYQPLSEEKFQKIKSGIQESFRDLCTGCQYCENCPEGIPISKMMDAYNQYLLLGQEQHALNQLKWHWNIPPSEADKCIGCGQCEEACTQHLNIIARLREISDMARRANR